MFSCLLLFDSFDSVAVQYLQFFQYEQTVHSIVAVSAERIPRHIENDKFLQVLDSINFLRVDNFVVAKIQFLETPQLRKIFEGGELIVLQRKLQKIVECMDTFDFGYTIFPQFQLLEVNQLRKVFNFCDFIFLQVKLLDQFAVLNKIYFFD